MMRGSRLFRGLALVLCLCLTVPGRAKEEVILYGGTVTRSIHYIAEQNRDTCSKGSTGYTYLQKILNGQE